MSAGLPLVQAIGLCALECELDDNAREAIWVVQYEVIIAERYAWGGRAVQRRDRRIAAGIVLGPCVKA